MKYSSIGICAAILVFCAFALAYYLSSHVPAIDPDGFNSQETQRISPGLVLIWTGGDNYTINDNDGIGVIGGIIRRIGHDNADADFIFIEYSPFEFPDKVTVVRMNKYTKESKIITGDVAGIDALVEVQSFLGDK